MQTVPDLLMIIYLLIFVLKEIAEDDYFGILS